MQDRAFIFDIGNVMIDFDLEGLLKTLSKGSDSLFRELRDNWMSEILISVETGRIAPARKRGIAEGFAAPFVLAILFFMIVLLTSAPMLGAVAEDKMQRVFEMLLASARPFDLIGGKILAAIGTALTSSIFYVVGAFVLLQALAIVGLAPMKIVPWFFLYLLCLFVRLSSW